jgi:hypothetical protein
MATQTQAKTGPGRSEKSFTIKVSEDALPVGLLPPSFPPDYVIGAVAPYLMGEEFVGEIPYLPMIDLAFSKEKAVPVQLWGMLYEGWTPNPKEEGRTVFMQGYDGRGPNNERKSIYVSATTEDLVNTKYRGKLVAFFDKPFANANNGQPIMGPISSTTTISIGISTSARLVTRFRPRSVSSARVSTRFWVTGFQPQWRCARPTHWRATPARRSRRGLMSAYKRFSTASSSMPIARLSTTS